MTHARWLPVIVVLLAACSSDDPAGDGTLVPGTTAAPSVPPTSPDTSVDATDMTAPCTTAGDTARKESDDPMLMSGVLGADIRTGAHECFERIVVELQGEGDFPGWWVEYVDDPVFLGQSDERVEIEGSHTLQVRMGMWMQDMEGNGYQGDTQMFPTNVAHVLELRMTENSEGISIWSIGLDAEYPFTVDVLTDPARLVIDVYLES